MKKTALLGLIFLISSLTNQTFAMHLAVLKGKVMESYTKQPLAGASVYISDLKSFTITNAAGEFTFKNVPARGIFLIEVRFLGYKTISKQIDLSNNTVLEFFLEPAVIESAEVVVTGTPYSTNNKTNSLAVVTINREKLSHSSSTNLIDAVAKVPGVSQITTGGAISKPIIRGLGYNRVLAIIDGAREEGQQWGDEHGIQADQFSAARVEILKGPASLLYGSDALGGVINIIDDLAPPEGDFNGSISTNYNTNAGLTASSIMVQGNAGGFVYRGRASYKNAYGFAYGSKVVPNSGFNEIDYSALLGLNKTWGYAHLSLSRFSTNIGLIEDGPDENGNYLDEKKETIISNAEGKKRKIDLPFQNINHYRVALNGNIILGSGQLKTALAFQQNIRKEFEESKTKPDLNLGLKSYTYDVKYALSNNVVWQPTFGIQGMYQTNNNKGNVFLIPDYKSNNIGVFAYLKRNFKNGSLNAGVRYDYKKINAPELFNNEKLIFSSFNNTFSNISGSIGAAIEIAKNLNFKANIGSGFRAPNIAELAAKGKHEGTFRYEIGNSKLKQETSLQFDLGLTYEAENITMGLNAYNNIIYNYIYLANLNGETIDFKENDNTSTLSVYRYVHTNANLMGGEASVDFHPIKSLHFENTFAYVKGTNKATNGSLPFIPAAGLNNELRLEPAIKGLAESYIKVGLTNVFKQDRFDVFETKTKGYTLLDAGLGTSIKTKSGKINLFIIGQNLTNKLYFNHLSRYKTVGIYNPGRNITFGIDVLF